MEHGDQHIGFGIMGGMNQPLAHAQFVSNVVDYHMNIQAAMEEARFTVSAKLGCNIVIESRVPPASLEKLGAMGHVLDVRKEYRPRWGADKPYSTTAPRTSTSEPQSREQTARLFPKRRDTHSTHAPVGMTILLQNERFEKEFVDLNRIVIPPGAQRSGGTCCST